MKDAIEAIDSARSVLVIQAENPDGDSLASSLALEEILGDRGKQVHMYCYVEIPKYLRYLEGWDRVSQDWPDQFDLAIIVDASTKALLERTLDDQHIRQLADKRVLLIDHHNAETDLSLKMTKIVDDTAVATGQIIADLARTGRWQINAKAANFIAASILSDSLGLSSTKTSAESIDLLAAMVRAGADLAKLDEKRRMMNKKSLDIFRYKGRLFERVELFLEGKLAVITIPWEEIEQYSDAYNPAMLIIDEMRLIDGVVIAAVIKAYPDGKLTVKLRANAQAHFMDELAAHFGGGGHPFAAGFKVYDVQHQDLINELLSVTREHLEKTRG